MEYALELENVGKLYKDKNFKLQDVSFNLPKGCIMGFIGENGAGKTTTIKLIMDLIKKDSGEIKVLGKDCPQNLNFLKENIGVVLDECFFPENLIVEDINKILKNIYRTWDKEKFNKYIENFNIPKNLCIKDFSKGEKMKLSISAALSHDSKLLILDEATSGLDPVVKDEILDIFMQFIQDENNSIFISSHILSDLEKICDYITFIHEGNIIFSEEKDVLLQKYGLLKCSESDFEKIEKYAVIGYRKNKFGIEALVNRNVVKNLGVMDKANIEDIMLFYLKKKED